MAPVLGYWSIRGLAQPIRLLLAYTETKFEDKKYKYGPAPDFDRREWMNEKFNLGLDFPNLPYYIDDDVKLTQSVTILRYLARKHKLDAENEQERVRADLMEQQVGDFKSGLTRISYSPEFDKLKEDYLKNLPTLLKQLSDYLGKNKWVVGDKLTYVDFLFHEALDLHKALAPDCLKDFQNLSDYVERFKKLPTIQKYMESADYMDWPFNGDMAKFGSRIK